MVKKLSKFIFIVSELVVGSDEQDTDQVLYDNIHRKGLNVKFFLKQNKYLTNIYFSGFFLIFFLTLGVTRLLVASAGASPTPRGILDQFVVKMSKICKFFTH